MNLAFDITTEKICGAESIAKHLSSKEKWIHQQAVQKAGTFKKAHAELLAAIMAVDTSRLFEKFLLNSTFSYCTKILGLSEDVTCTLTRLARVSAVVPELKMAIDDGSLNMSNARQIAAILTPDNKTEWLEKAKTLPQKKLQHEVAKFFPQQAVQEKAKFVSEERVKLEIGLDVKVMDDLRRAQDLISQKLSTSASIEVTLEQVLKFYLERNDSLLKAKRAGGVTKKTKKPSVAIRGAEQKSSPIKMHSVVLKPPKRKALSAAILHEVNLRDSNQCQAQFPDGQICANTRWLEHHHIIPVQYGGQDTAENLITLCSFHHRLYHQ